MLSVVENADFAIVEMLLLSIPESLGLLAAGIALVAVAVSLRLLLARPVGGHEVKGKRR